MGSSNAAHDTTPGVHNANMAPSPFAHPDPPAQRPIAPVSRDVQAWERYWNERPIGLRRFEIGQSAIDLRDLRGLALVANRRVATWQAVFGLEKTQVLTELFEVHKKRRRHLWRKRHGDFCTVAELEVASASAVDTEVSGSQLTEIVPPSLLRS